jgi:MerR family mercuric resistance operon transcriptional regulator
MPSRSESRYRLYSDDDLLRLKFIKRLKELGFSLKEIFAILQLLKNDRSENKEILKDEFSRKINEIDNKILALTALKEALNVSRNNPGLGECEFLNLFYKNS